jgi:Asp/Glu/hydantoin racemase
MLVLVHTPLPLLPVFDRLVPEILPGIHFKHILDEPLLEAVRQRGSLAGTDIIRLHEHVSMAESIGARAVLVTCSTVSPLVDKVRDMGSAPVLKIDEAMLDAAVQAGSVLAVLATNSITLGLTRQLLQERARAAGRELEIETHLVPGALDALLSGDGPIHDRLLSSAIREIAAEFDAVVLAQASMARVLEADVVWTKPVLSSPQLALQQLRSIFY